MTDFDICSNEEVCLDIYQDPNIDEEKYGEGEHAIIVNKLEEEVGAEEVVAPPVPSQQEMVLSADDLRKAQQHAFDLALIN